MIDGLDYVKDGDKVTISLGYWLMNVVHFGKDQEMTPLYNKLCSFDHGAKSENKEVLEAMVEVDLIIDKYVTKYLTVAWTGSFAGTLSLPMKAIIH